jgi:membrane-bound lytic murein transglycosylase D
VTHLRSSALALVLSLVAAPAFADPPKPAPKPPAAKPAPPPAKPNAAAKPGPKGKPGKGPKPPRNGPDEAARRSIAGGPTTEDATKSAESPELKALREAEREVFSPAAPRPGNPWPNEAPYPVPIDPDRPAAHASGLPPSVSPRDGVAEQLDKEPELAWIKQLKLPDLPVRWDSRVIRYLQFFRDDPRGRSTAAYGWRRSGKYGESIRKALRAERVPEALVWVAMVESGFDPVARSSAGAAGLFQFTPDGGSVYGLRVERGLDERLDPVKSTTAAAKYMSDLQRRFGTWEMALAAYNMGFGGLLAAVRKYNTNDYWELSRLEAGIPWETTLYVPKIIAMAVVAENPAVFGLEPLPRDPAVAFDEVKVRGGVSTEAIAVAAGVKSTDVEALNPQLRAKRTPWDEKGETTFAVRIPPGHGADASRRVEQLAPDVHLERYTVRFGQTVELIAQEIGIPRGRLAELNGMSAGELLRPGDTVFVPAGLPRRPAERPTVVAPASPSAIPGTKRVFYRVIPGDTLRAIATAFSVLADDLRAWNAVDPSARLQEGMTLQVFVPPDRDLSTVNAIREEDATILTVGTDAFFAWFEAQKGRHRIAITVRPNDTWKSVSAKYGLSVGMLERINRRGRDKPLVPGETILVYTGKAGGDAPTREDSTLPPMTGDLPATRADEPAMMGDLRKGAPASVAGRAHSVRG